MKIRKLLVAFAILLNLSPLVLAQSVVYAQAKDAVCSGVGLAGNGGDTGCTQTTGNTVEDVLRLGLQIFSLIIGIAAVIMIMVGGLRYITSGGDSGRLASAKDTILYAIIGLVVVALAQIIVKFVINKVG